LSSLLELNESISIIITILVLSIVFGSDYLLRGSLLSYIFITIVAAIAVIPHEMAHRWSARKMGCYSRYVLNPIGLILTLITAPPFIPIKFIMPGYTLVIPYTYNSRNLKHIDGVVSFAGPVTNILIAGVSILLLTSLVKIGIYDPLLIMFLLYNGYLNSWIAFFNLIPIPPLDGSKIISWKPHLWISALLVSIGMWLFVRGF